MGLGSSYHANEDVPNKHTGMTKRQMRTLHKSWKLLKKDRQKHSIKIFVRLFRKYPIYRRYFLDVPGVKMSDLARHPGVLAHCDAFMKSMDRLLNAALKKPESMMEVNLYQAHCHKDMAIGEIGCKRMTETLIDYLRKEFPKETTDYVANCWQQYLDMSTQQYVDNYQTLWPDEDEDDLIPVHASRKVLSPNEETEKTFWDKHHEYWRIKKATWAESNPSTYEIEDEEHEDSYIEVRNKNSRCCGASSVFGGKEKSYAPSDKPLVGKEITETRSITAIKQVNIDMDDTGKSLATDDAVLPTVNSGRSVDYSSTLRKRSDSLASEYSTTSEKIHPEPSPLDVSIRRSSLPPTYYERRLSDLFPKREVNENNYVTPSYVPGRNIDELDIPMPKFFKKEHKDKKSHSVTFNNETKVREYEDYSQETVANGPRERRRKWNEFTSCCNKRNSYY